VLPAVTEIEQKVREVEEYNYSKEIEEIERNRRD
jgi:hypothetical protein